MTHSVDTLRKLALIKGSFTPTEAEQVLGKLLQEKINFHKEERLQNWIREHNGNTQVIETRIAELRDEKQNLRRIIEEARKAGFHLEIKGDIEIRFVEATENPLNLGDSSN
ncbi:MAG: hypothetical protein D6772_07935 [Bacteroidetes bacterium]|nr:MAG: hypothetical protein D6772_07935 [Bacteroidota bacterium]